MSLFNDFKNSYPSANLDKFAFVSDSYGGYIKWKYNGITVMTNDDLLEKHGLMIYHLI